MYLYLHDEFHALTSKFVDEGFLVKLTFLTDLFERLNIMNSSLEGSKTTIFQFISKVEGFKNSLWKKNLIKGDYTMFASLNQLLLLQQNN